MKGYQCDQCDVFKVGEPEIFIRGYWPRLKGGLMIPERYKEREFCSRKCFKEWIGLGELPDMPIWEGHWKPCPFCEITRGFCQFCAGSKKIKVWEAPMAREDAR